MRTAVFVLMGLVLAAPAGADAKRIEELVKRLADREAAPEAVKGLVALGQPAVHRLGAVAAKDGDLTQRGWAIVCLAEIGGKHADGALAEIVPDTRHPMLVRTWAAAGRVNLAADLQALLALREMLDRFPAVRRPFGLRATALSGPGSAEALLELAARDPALQQSLVPMILAAPPEELVRAMIGGRSPELRQQAAAVLATQGQQGKPVAKAVLAAYTFQASAAKEPWAGGALFVPSIPWSNPDARALADRLIRWLLWAERKGRKDLTKQIHNNLRSLELARAAGYSSPGWVEMEQFSADQWLAIWGRAVGRAALEALLLEQEAAHEPRWKKILEELR